MQEQISQPGSERRSPPRRLLLFLIALWLLLYGSFTLVRPPLLDDADSVHAEVAREMVARHDWITLYANGIRYLEKAPLLYWSMAASFRCFGAHTWSARLPLALYTLALLLVVFALGRRCFDDPLAGFYAALVLATSFGMFIFTRILIPDAMVCLWLTLAILCFWRSLTQPTRANAAGFAVACVLGVLTKGLIGLVFPLLIVAVYLAMTRNLAHLRRWHPVLGALIFFAIAAPWHAAAGMANPTEGHPGALPTSGNVHGFYWFYFINEHLLRYLNQRVPRDYDTVPLALFWGLLLVWMLPWSAFLVPALRCMPLRRWWHGASLNHTERARLLLFCWAAVPMVFFSFSTRQEYYVLPAMPALALLVGGWLAGGSLAQDAGAGHVPRPRMILAWLLFAAGACGAAVALFFALHSGAPQGDLAAALSSNPGDYALSFGHFLDLSTRAMAFFRLPLLLTAVALLASTGGHLLLRRAGRGDAAIGTLAAGSVLFLIAAHIALVTFAPVLSSAALADAIRPKLRPDDVIVLNGEYESGSTLGFYLHRQVRILNGRSSNLWYGSFFSDAPGIFDDDASVARLWSGPRRVFLLTDAAQPPHLPDAVYTIATSSGKAVLSNRP
ncbi:MAG TPA: glycosyltransferase family 39 protein [Acidobacteriaceae bacterium]|jgi:4-amino-4-deoxy-L-arabinose transferase-like glycosyltransferase